MSKYNGRKVMSVDPDEDSEYAKTQHSRYRIVCLDDPFEETLYFDTKLGLVLMCQGWDEDGYETIKDFNKYRRGIHSAQMKRNGKWITAK